MLSSPQEPLELVKTHRVASRMNEKMFSPCVWPSAWLSGMTRSVSGSWNSAACVLTMNTLRPAPPRSSTLPTVSSFHTEYRAKSSSFTTKEMALKMQLAPSTKAKNGLVDAELPWRKLGSTPKTTATNTPRRPKHCINEYRFRRKSIESTAMNIGVQLESSECTGPDTYGVQIMPIVSPNVSPKAATTKKTRYGRPRLARHTKSSWYFGTAPERRSASSTAP
mmetsp:Transcript_129905/g.363582  ORF Transcript_129905/g.363582 Transcript_129905/m.363582 type:complete len:222 (+) Transcript_129905:409-1074(+)